MFEQASKQVSKQASKQKKERKKERRRETERSLTEREALLREVGVRQTEPQ